MRDNPRDRFLRQDQRELFRPPEIRFQDHSPDRGGFLSAYCRWPAAYLDHRIRAAISSFWLTADISEALARLECDVESGAWAERYGELLALDDCDRCYSLVVSR